jgi:hypothetical protein
MIAVPAFSPLMSPDDETPATVGALLDHVTVVLSFAPLGSRTVAVACSVCPTVTLALGAVTVTLATVGAVTTSVALDEIAFTVAVIFAVPAFRPLTNPALDTLATPGGPLVHDTISPVIALPDASSAVATAAVVCPTWMVEASNATVTAATAAGSAFTFTTRESDFPSADAVMVAVPGASAATLPDAVTLATSGLELDQVTRRSWS